MCVFTSNITRRPFRRRSIARLYGQHRMGVCMWWERMVGEGGWYGRWQEVNKFEKVHVVGGPVTDQ